MAVAGTVEVNFAAETAKFTAELKKVRGDMRGLREEVGNITGAFDKLGTGLKAAFSGAAIAGFARWVGQAGKGAVDLANFSDRLGITVDKLQDFQYAAGLADVEFTTLTNALEKAQKNLGDAAAGTGEAARWIEALGLNVKELRTLSPDQLFETYSDSIRSLSDRSQQAAASQALFGKAAKDAQAIILDGRQILADSAAEVDRLGIRLSELDIRKIQAAKDQFDKLELATANLGAKIAASLSPYVTQLGEKFFEATAQGDKLQERIDAAVRVGVTGFYLVRNATLAFDTAVSAVVVGVTELSNLMFKLATTIPTLLLTGVQKLADVAGADGIAAKAESARQTIANVSNFLVAVSDTATARVQANLEQIKSFAQIAAVVDQIIADANARAAASIKGGAGAFGDNEAVLGAGKQDTLGVDQQDEFKLRIEREIEAEAEKNLRLLELQEEYFQNRRDLAQQAELEEQQFRNQTAFAAVAVFSFVASKSKSARKAMSVANKAADVADVIRTTAVGASKAIAIYGPTPVGFAAAAAAIAFGALQLKSILSTDGGGGGGSGALSGGGGASSALAAEQSNLEDEKSKASATQGKVLQLTVNGNLFSSRETVDWLLQTIAGEINGNDTVVINGDSRQALELRGG